MRLWEILEGVQLQPTVSDRFVWKWTENGTYSASSARRSFFIGTSSMLGAKEIWQVAVPPKVKLGCGRQIARNGMGCKMPTCALCDLEIETCSHLLLSCVYTREVWCYIHILQPVGLLRRQLSIEELVPWWLRTRM